MTKEQTMTKNRVHLAAIDLITEELVVAYEGVRFIKNKAKARQREWETRRQYREIKHDQMHRDIMRSLNLQRTYVAELEASLKTLKLQRKAVIRFEFAQRNGILLVKEAIRKAAGVDRETAEKLGF
jgi:hypothetical protein